MSINVYSSKTGPIRMLTDHVIGSAIPYCDLWDIHREHLMTLLSKEYLFTHTFMLMKAARFPESY